MPSQIHSFIRPGTAPVVLTKKDVCDSAIMQLRQMGVHIDRQFVADQVHGLMGGSDAPLSGRGADAASFGAITGPSVTTPLQFLQAWLPGFVKVLTAARKIDEAVGITTIGRWEDAEIVQGIVEPFGVAAEYGDNTNIPLSSFNANFERRAIVRSELGFSVGVLEDERAAAVRLNSASEKRANVALALEIWRNAVGFYGWASTTGTVNRTFGFLNDPLLPAAGTLPSAKTWDQANFQEMTKDLRTMIAKIRTQSQNQIDPEKVGLVLALPMNKVDHLSTTTDMGISVRDWLKQTYPNVKVISIPELMGASDANADLAYMYAETIDSAIDGASDGGQVFMQMVPQKLRTLGVEKRAKSYVEDFASSSAGVLCKRPWAVTRWIGL